MVNVSVPGMKGMVGMASRVFGAMSADVSIVLITNLLEYRHQFLY